MPGPELIAHTLSSVASWRAQNLGSIFSPAITGLTKIEELRRNEATPALCFIIRIIRPGCWLPLSIRAAKLSRDSTARAGGADNAHSHKLVHESLARDERIFRIRNMSLLPMRPSTALRSYYYRRARDTDSCVLAMSGHVCPFIGSLALTINFSRAYFLVQLEMHIKK